MPRKKPQINKVHREKTIHQIKCEREPYFDYKWILQKLPKKEVWTGPEVAEAFGVVLMSISKASRAYNLGRKLPTQYGRGGSWIFNVQDIKDFCYILKGSPPRKTVKRRGVYDPDYE